MASKYIYYWDTNDKKKRYGGKYEKINPQGSGYYGNNTAGNTQEFSSKNWGTDVGFVGSNTKEYTFSDNVHGTRTITAESFPEALRIAESLGYTQSDYRKRRGRK